MSEILQSHQRSVLKIQQKISRVMYYFSQSRSKGTPRDLYKLPTLIYNISKYLSICLLIAAILKHLSFNNSFQHIVKGQGKIRVRQQNFNANVQKNKQNKLKTFLRCTRKQISEVLLLLSSPTDSSHCTESRISGIYS